MPKKTTKKHDPDVLRGIGRGPWACLWADREEEAGRDRSLSGQDIYEIADPTPRWVARWAKKVADAIVSLNGGASLADLYQAAASEGYANGPEAFGSDLGMQVVGSGVSWTDSVSTDLVISLPSSELYEGASPDLRFAKGR